MMNFLKNKIAIIAAFVVLAAIAGYWYFGREAESPYETIAAKKGEVVQEVGVTGKIKPAQSVNLAFERSGKVSAVFVKVGDKVKAGQSLIALDNSELSAQLNQAEASLAAAEANLAELKRGSRPEEIQIAETTVSNAQKARADAEVNLENVKAKADTDLANLYDGVKDILNDAYIKADDAVNKQTDEMFSNDLTTSPQLTFIVTSQQSEIDAETGRFVAAGVLSDFQSEIANLSGGQAALDAALVNAESRLNSIKDFLETLSEALNYSAGLSSTTLASYKGYVNAGRTNVQAALSNVSSRKQSISAQKITNQNNVSSAEAKVNDAKNALVSAQNELILKKAGATAEQIAAQEAAVRQSEASVQNIKAQLAKTVLYSPIAGVVAKREDARVGEIVSANMNVVSVISEAKFEIEANVAEADIAKIKTGDKADVTLDAYGSDVVFQAVITEIEPAETVLEGVATYKTTLQFVESDERVKSGMTANVGIISARRENAVKIPQRAVISRNGDKFAKILDGEEVRESEILTGIRGSDGWVEIIQGVEEGDIVVLSEK